jgi:3-oxoacyl-[acyl-carrier-protein] synthase II
MSRILVTAAGVNSPLGCSLAEFITGMKQQVYGIDHIKNFDTQFFPADFAAEVHENGRLVKTDSSKDRKALFINRAVQELVGKSRDFLSLPPNKRMLHLGAGMDHFDLVGYLNSENTREGLWQKYCQPSDLIVTELAKLHHIEGGSSVNVSACVASSQAMGLSFRILQQRSGIGIISGGFDSMLSPLHYMGFYKLGAFSQYQGEARHACRPFDKNRSGLVLGEGGAAFFMQRAEDRQHDRPMMEICGYGCSMDAFNITDPHPEGTYLAQAALQAIQEADLSPDDIDCVHTHGTGTSKNEVAEAKAMELIFSKRYREIPVFSLKAQIGHLIGACGAMEMLGVWYSLDQQLVPATLNFQDADPEVPLRVIKNEPLPYPINHILKLNSGFGGQNTALVAKKYHE